MPIATAFAAGPRGRYKKPPPVKDQGVLLSSEDYSEFLICIIPRPFPRVMRKGTGRVLREWSVFLGAKKRSGGGEGAWKKKRISMCGNFFGVLLWLGG